MERYRVLRHMGFGYVASALVSFLNWGMGVPRGYIGIMNLVIDYNPEELPWRK